MTFAQQRDFDKDSKGDIIVNAVSIEMLRLSVQYSLSHVSCLSVIMVTAQIVYSFYSNTPMESAFLSNCAFS